MERINIAKITLKYKQNLDGRQVEKARKIEPVLLVYNVNIHTSG